MYRKGNCKLKEKKRFYDQHSIRWKQKKVMIVYFHQLDVVLCLIERTCTCFCFPRSNVVSSKDRVTKIVKQYNVV